MMAQLGGGKINPHPCTPEDAIANWQIQNQINENITLQDTFKVKVSGTDGAEGYLAETIANAADTFSSNEDLPIAKEIQTSGGDESLLVYVDSSAIPSYNTSGTYAICMVDGVTRWFDTTSFGGSGSDDKTVKVSGDDTTNSYLYAKTKDQADYTATSDLLIHADITDFLAEPGSGDEHVRWFIDASSITGDAGSGTILLGKVGGGWQFIDASDVVDDLTLVRLTLAGSTLTADQQFQMLRGQCTGNVLAGDATFSVDHIELLSDCKDPRSVHGSTSETLTIHKEDVKTGLRNDDWIVAVRSDTDSQWELLCTERYRSIRGTWYSGLSTLTIDNITVLGNGLDPRTVTTSTAETVSVSNPSNSVFVADDTVYADWNSRLGVWEARPKVPETTLALCRVTTEITAASDNLVENWGSGEVRTMDIATGELSVGTSAVRNPWNIVFPVDAMVEIVGDIVKNGTCGEYPWAAEA